MSHLHSASTGTCQTQTDANTCRIGRRVIHMGLICRSRIADVASEAHSAWVPSRWRWKRRHRKSTPSKSIGSTVTTPIGADRWAHMLTLLITEHVHSTPFGSKGFVLPIRCQHSHCPSLFNLIEPLPVEVLCKP